MNRVIKTVICTVSVLAAMNAAAAVVLTTKSPDGVETSIFQNNTLVFLENGKSQMIIKAKTDTCIAFNHAGRKYLQMKCSEFFKSMNQMVSGFQQMAEQMLPPGAKEQMGAAIPPMNLVKSGSGKYQGFNVDKYQIKIQNDVVVEYWISKKVMDMVKKEIDFKKYKNIFMDPPEVSGPMADLQAALQKKEEALEEKGYIVKRISYVENGPGAKPVISETKINKKSVNIKQYLPAKNYKRVNSMQDMM